MALTYSNAVRSAQNNALITFAGTNAIINLYAGTPPANANTAITTQTLLVSLPIVGAFGTDSNGVLTLNPVTATSATNGGVATFFRITKSDGTTVVMDGSIGTSGADLILNTTTIVALQTVSITSGTIIRNNQ
jgi:hypothetical protein